VRRVNQLTDSSSLLTDFGANFYKKVWVFLIEILGFFLFLVSSKIFGCFSKLIFLGFLGSFLFQIFFLVWGFFLGILRNTPEVIFGIY